MPETIYDISNEKFETNFNSFGSWVSEAFGAFLYVFMFMMCTDKKTQFSKDKVINTFITASSYIAARLMSGGYLVTCMTSLTSPALDTVDNNDYPGVSTSFEADLARA